jgi:hypothetical protein
MHRDPLPRWRKLAVMLTLTLVATALVVSPAAGAGGKNHFRPSGAFEGAEGAGGEAGELRTPQQYEEEAQDNPVTGSQSLFSQCRFAPFAGRTDIYGPFAAWEHDAIVGDTEFGFADGTSCYNPQNEQNIVINPKNPANVVTSANEYRDDSCRVYVSDDGAQTWTNVILPGWSAASGATDNFKYLGCGGDPVLAFAPDGTLYFAGLGYNFDKFPRTKSGVAVATSTDGGHHWSKPKMVDYNATGNTFQDKEWIGVGPDGRVYLTWTRFYQGPRGLSYYSSPILMSMSKDHGANWTAPKPVSDASHPYNQGSQVGATADGSIWVAYEGSSPSTDYATDALVLARSRDGGRTWTNSEVARIYDDLDCYPIQQPGGQDRQTLTNEQFRINSFPSMAIDPSNGHIAITWADNEGSGSCGAGGTTFAGTTSNQVKLVTFDGSSWGSVRTITSGAADKVYPSVGINGGKIAVGYYTREFATGAPGDTCAIVERDTDTGALVPPADPDRASANVCLDFALKTSADNFAATTRVSGESSNPYILFSGSFIGDYTGTAVDAQGNVATVWTDFRGNPGLTSPNQDTIVGYLPH